MTLQLTLMSGAGNIFSVLDNRRYRLSLQEAQHLAPELCTNVPISSECGTPTRSTEGLVIVEEATEGSDTDFTMLFFNPDGSTGAMCGNGGRCAVHFAVQEQFTHKKTGIRFRAFDTLYSADYTEQGSIRLYFPPPKTVIYPYQLKGDEFNAEVGIIDLGSDHVVVFFDELVKYLHDTTHTLHQLDIEYWGKQFRHHPDFPRGANANFYSIITPDSEPPLLQLRTFERGVEAETGACGTGALSTALIACLRHDLRPPIQIIPTSGNSLLLHFIPDIHHIRTMILEGAAENLNTFYKEVL